MAKSLSRVGIVALVLCVAAQAALSQTAPSFEVASVRRNISGEQGMSIRTLPGGGFYGRNVPLRNLVRHAYGLQIQQVEGGPSWMEDARFNIEARAANDVPFNSPAIMLMLRTLLRERFQLRVHTESRQRDVFVLTMARADRRFGNGLRRSTIDCAAITAFAPLQRENQATAAVSSVPQRRPSEPNCSLRVGSGNTLRVDGVTIAKLAEYLQPDVGRIVIDETGLSGTFDIELTYAMNFGGPALIDAVSPAPRSEAPAILVAVPEQLGLKMESQRRPVEVLVIDAAELPSEN